MRAPYPTPHIRETTSRICGKRREGNSIFYSRALPNHDKGLAPLHQQLYEMVDRLPLSTYTQEQIRLVKQERAEQSQAFFEQHSEQFKEQQDLIADYSTYGEAVAHLLAKVLEKKELPHQQLALEIGPGEGEFLPVLANYFEQVIALDNAAVMLDHARYYCEQKKIANVKFVCDDTHFLQAKGKANTVDCIVTNMVLHHTPSPADIFQDIAVALRLNGVLIVTELCRHDQGWTKEACGDLWLGFDPSELQVWAQAAGLQHGHSHYFALRNGFQIQLQQFKKTS